MILAVDSGNTNVKWGIFDGHKWLVLKINPHFDYIALADSWKSLPSISLIIISNVAGTSARKSLTDLLPLSSSKPLWIEATRTQCGLINNYYNSESLGSDRWASMIAIWNQYHEPSLIVTVGTAMTVDMISASGDFVGGIITPGVSILNNALADKTSLPSAETGIYDSFSLSTENALFTGVIDSLVGVIEKVYCSMLNKYHYKKIHCVLSGGDSKVLLPYLDPRFTLIDNLVLKGLLVIAQSRK